MEEKHASADYQSGSCRRVDVARSPSVLPFPAPTSAGFQPPSHPHATGQFSKTWSQSCHSVEPYIISQWQRMKCKTAPGVNLFSCKPFSWTLCPLACTGYAPTTLVGNSLKVQWLELCILAGELKSHKPCCVAENKQTNKQPHSRFYNCACYPGGTSPSPSCICPSSSEVQIQHHLLHEAFFILMTSGQLVPPMGPWGTLL